MLRRLFFWSLLLVSLDAHSAGMQKWVDADGNTHYGERPPGEVTATSVETKVSVSGSAAAPSAPKVILYSASWCGYCKKAVAYMNQNRINFEELDIETNKSAKRDYERAPGRGIPYLVRGKESIRGFSKARYDRFFSE